MVICMACRRTILNIDADIREPATEGASSCADCCTEQRIEARLQEALKA
jgi:hypothetical protein